MPVLVSHGAHAACWSTANCCACRAQSSRRACWSSTGQAHAGRAEARSISIRRNSCRRSCSASSAIPVIRKTPTGQPSTAEDVLEELAADYRAAEAHPRVSGRRETEVHLHRQAAGADRTATPAAFIRLITRRWRRPAGCPRRIRTCRTSRSAPPRDGASARPSSRRQAHCLVAADYSQIELRIMAHLSGDAGLARAPSPRTATSTRRPQPRSSACRLDAVSADQRRSAKAINFGLIYGMSAFGLARQLGIGARRRAAIRGPVLRTLPGREALHGGDQAPRRARRATSKRCSAAGSTCPRSHRATRRCGSTPNAARSTRRCRAPRPTSSSGP